MHYDWGDLCALHDFCGTNADGEPLAEIWYGTHRGGPSVLDDGTFLEDVVSPRRADSRVDGLPYLVKLIAPAKPLSIQVHPSREQAEVGFAVENNLRIPLNAPERTFVDRNHKPEMILALEPWRALVGFAPERELIRFNEEVGTPLALRIASLLAVKGLELPVYTVLKRGLHPPVEELLAYVRRCSALKSHADEAISKRAGMVEFVHSYFPRHTSVLVAALMNIVDLAPGEALFTPVGTIHSYLSGVGLEVMASSANTIRAGLTSKHIDVEGLLSTAKLYSTPPILVQPSTQRVCRSVVRTYQPAVNDFRLDIADIEDCVVRGVATNDTLLVAIDREALVNGMSLPRGEAMWVPASVAFEVSGPARVALVSTASEPVRWLVED